MGTKISEATLRETLKGSESLPIVDNDLPKGRTTAANLKTYCAPDLSGYAKKSEIPSTEGLLSKAQADKDYQPKGDYITTIPDEYVTDSELDSKGYETTTHASQTYQLKGDYVLKSEIPDVSGLATKQEVQAKLDTNTYTSDKATFALKSEIPTDYATEEDIQEAISGINIEDLVIYGVEFDTSVSSPDCTRIGNPNLHRTLPVHSQMRGCLLNDDGEVTKYLNESDWTSETRDGSQGQVMVEVPEHYVKFETEGTKRRVKMSITPVVGYKKISRYYVSAYEATVQRSTSKLSSVVNTDADYRGGSNNTEWDGTYRSLLGTPATSISRTNFRTYARNRKEGSTEWNCMTYDIQKDLYWLFVVEYATLNTQKAFNSAKTSEGYAQGGLGDGFTTLDWNKWTNFNGNYPVVPCGYTDELGNGTGQKEYSMPSEYDATIKKLYVPRYRGVENPFGHIWQWTDGINVQIEPGDGLSKVFVCDDPSKFNDSNYDGYQHVGNEARTEAYVKSVIFGEKGEIIPDVVGGSSSTYFCDYHYTNIPTTETLRGVRFGGAADAGSYAGFVYASSPYVPSATSAHFGSRLCFIPE